MAVANVNIEVEKGEVLGLIGPNGAGKSTLLNIIAGVFPPSKGKIIFKEMDITGKKANEICKLGIAKTSQIVKPFTKLTVFENVYLGAVYGAGLTKKKAIEKTEEIIEFTKLNKYKNKLADSLSVPERRKLEFARALATEPQILLLDENMAGLTPKEIDDSLDLIREINSNGITIIIVEHIMRAVLGVAKRIVVLNYGEKIADGKPEEVLNDKRVLEAYFGKS